MNADKAMQRVGRVSRLEATASRTQMDLSVGLMMDCFLMILVFGCLVTLDWHKPIFEPDSNITKRRIELEINCPLKD